MFKNAVLTLSILMNCAIAYLVIAPSIGPAGADKMSCAEARNEIASKEAISAYGKTHGGSLAKVHEFLTNSDYQLRNIDVSNGTVSFVYTSSAFYPSACSLHLPGLDGGIVRVDTDIDGTPSVRQVW
ncbi:hypothetical protein SAMN05880561_103612 [Rhizobium sp. RU33A]|uniref:hypothetical protein n=1 Tax=Rhizobium sp. RU33A TaxID=1907413 RepID=UPI0009540291|nr:hypothetical protein [Rhizobium sp. RU33A]SIQ58007.1 hypothetical protein SAMN05880561_103612 [Rhizobium sp. RU33A]